MSRARTSLIWLSIARLLSLLVPPGDALGDLLLEAAVDRLVIGLRLHLLGPVSVARKAALGIVVVAVALAVADVLHQPGRGVEDVLGRHQRARLLRRAPGG